MPRSSENQPLFRRSPDLRVCIFHTWSGLVVLSRGTPVRVRRQAGTSW